MTNGSLMKVKKYCRMLPLEHSAIFSECSLWSILQYFWPALSENWSWKPIFCLFWEWPFYTGFTVIAELATMHNFNILAGLCSWAGWFEQYLVSNLWTGLATMPIWCKAGFLIILLIFSRHLTGLWSGYMTHMVLTRVINLFFTVIISIPACYSEHLMQIYFSITHNLSFIKHKGTKICMHT